MMKLIFLGILLLLPISNAHTQLQDDFSDGDFANAPSWIGDTEKFTVTNEELQLADNDPQSNNTHYLAVAAATSGMASTTWEFYVRLEFAPSSSNFARIYLNASSSNLSESQEGYYLQVGGISGDGDALELYRQDGNSSTLLISGTTGAVGQSPAIASVRITRSSAGEWELSADYNGGLDLQTEGTATDTTYPMGNFFGFYCQYTSTRSQDFFLDDVLVSPLFVDTQPPVLLSVTPDNATQLRVQFDEALSPSSAGDATNFLIDNNIGQPLAAEAVAGNPRAVRLDLANPLQNGQTYQLTATNISDSNSNTAGPQSLLFTFFDIQDANFQDVIISELMPDPTPPLGLPEAEFLELYNRSDKVIQLSTLSLSAGGSPIPLPDYLFLPDSYVILCDEGLSDLFSTLGPAIGLSGFPTLVNSGDELQLTNTDEALIFELAYTDSWYRDDDKDGGGYSLELIQLEGPYDCPGNWRASENASGGTPGQPNSLLGATADQTPPRLSSVVANTSQELLLTFNEVMDEAALAVPANYQLTPSITISNALPVQGGLAVQLSLDSPLSPQTAYEILISQNITDCIGNSIGEQNTGLLGLDEPAAAFDLILSEIFPDPNPQVALPAADFLELHNRSDKILNLAGITLQANNSSHALPPRLLFPGDYLILCDEAFAEAFAPFGSTTTLESFPALATGGGRLSLLGSGGALLFEVNYDDSWYHDDDKDGGGYSLELIQLEGPYDCPGNWRASENASGGTPGQPNSLLGSPVEDVAPRLLSAIPESNFELRLSFSTKMDASTLEKNQHYTIRPEIPILDVLVQPGATQVILVLQDTLSVKIAYELSLSSEITNCLGASLEGSLLLFGLPEPLQSMDVVINEILFNPESGGNDYLELYNRSDKLININALFIANTFKESGDTLGEINQDFLLFPGAYVALTESPADILSRFSVERPEALLEASLPTFDDREGNITLRFQGQIIDAFDYEESLHYPLLDSKEGVSLERLSPDAPTQSNGNWHSAASTAGFGTPTYQNSQFMEQEAEGTNLISLPSKTFSPDGDGFEDVLLINYETGQAGFTLNLQIFDSYGRLARRLANNELLPAKGVLKWDGTTDDNSRARIGIYIIWAELFNPEGVVQREKIACVLAGKLE